MNQVSPIGYLGRFSATVALGVALMAGAPSPASAQPVNQLVNDISINGTGLDSESGAVSDLTGAVTITNIAFDAASNALLFTGSLTGSVTGDGVTTEILNQLFTTTGTLTGGNGNGKGKGNKCAILNLDLGPLDLDLLGLQVDLSEVELDLTAVRGPGKLLGNLLCGLAGLLDAPNLDQITRQLDRINGLLGSVLDNTNVQGLLPGGGDFTGFLTIDNLGVDNADNLVIGGVLNGVATVGGVVTPIVNQAINTTGTLTGGGGNGKGKKCQILNLDLGPINLDLLGLQVDLSEVMLDVAGTKGPGKLLGNLLCGLAGALDGDAKGNNPDKQAKKLLKSVQKINNLL